MSISRNVAAPSSPSAGIGRVAGSKLLKVHPMKTSSIPNIGPLSKTVVLLLTTLVALSVSRARAADIEWQGGTASYTNAGDWVGGVVPGPSDNPINSNGTNNVLEINIG